MSRNGSGTYSVPNTFTAGTTITASSHNQNWSDVASEMTNSVAADGQTSMTGPLKASAGSVGAPSMTFAADQDTGRYRKASNTIADVVGGAEVVEISSTGIAVTGNISATDINATGAIKQDGFSLLPLGIVMPYAGSTAPSGYLLCYGQAVSRTTYADLFAIIGTTYGSGDGSTTFNVPDLRGRVAAGKDDMGGSAASRLTAVGLGVAGTTLGNAGSTESYTLVTGNLPPYTPSGTIAQAGFTYTAGSNYDVTGSSFGVTTIAASGLGTTVTLAAQSFTGAAQGGTSTAFSRCQPTIILNYIIFAGA